MHDLKGFSVIKANGEQELFNTAKLKRSLEHAGVDKKLVDRIAVKIVETAKEGMTSFDIYELAFSLLRKYEQRPVAGRYALRRAIFELGPSGYPFEDYVAKIFEALGYQSATQQIVKGNCVSHEVDIVAYTSSRYVGAELKFHNRPGIKTDLKVALYVHARFEDIKQSQNDAIRIDEGWLITNTKFTKNAISFARCAGLTLLGWNYPKNRSLQRLIEETAVYPITCLSTLNAKEKTNLLDQKLVLCKDLEHDIDTLKKAGVGSSKLATVIEESQALCAL